MKLGIGFVKGDGWVFSKLIRLLTRGKWSHCFLEVSDELIFEAEILQRCQLLRKEQVDYYDLEHEIIHINIDSKEQAKMYELIEDALGKDYDYNLIWKIFKKILFKCKITKTTEDNFICSELVGWMLFNMGLVDNEEVMSMSPNVLYNYLKSNLKG